MLIKGVVSKDSRTARKGDPIPISAEDALDHAVLRGLKEKYNSAEKIYFVQTGSVICSDFRKTVTDAKKGTWVAVTQGDVMIGSHVHKGDKNLAPKPYKFSLTYKSGEDENGMPDIELVEFVLEPASESAPKIDIARFEQKKLVAGAVKKPAENTVAAVRTQPKRQPSDQ
jgi:hypothetical protein